MISGSRARSRRASLRLLVKGWIASQDQHQFLLGKGNHLQGRGIGFLGDQGQLIFVDQQAAGDFSRTAFIQDDMDPRVLFPEGGDQGRHEVLGVGLGGADLEGPFFQVLQLPDGPFGGRRQVENFPGIAEEESAGLGHFDPFPVAVKQGDLEIMLQLPDLHGHRRLGQIEFFGGSGETLIFS